jgi:hypothetical protein
MPFVKVPEFPGKCKRSEKQKLESRTRVLLAGKVFGMINTHIGGGEKVCLKNCDKTTCLRLDIFFLRPYGPPWRKLPNPHEHSYLDF